MRKEFVDMLCCPTCKGDLDIVITKERKDEILEGTLICKACQCNYSIEKGIPHLLPK
ncbi:MAG: Trm112 family protein [Candidatus Thermoplasmatota archaeon]|nr:Trm112 family protein [Candidatus Thermoplasmatota archaeon]